MGVVATLLLLILGVLLFGADTIRTVLGVGVALFLWVMLYGTWCIYWDIRKAKLK
jgi:hypothetical protein